MKVALILLGSAFFASGPLTVAQAENKAPAAAPKVSVDQTDKDTLVSAVQKAYEKTDSFEADFQQTYKSKVFRRSEKSNGHLAYHRPGQMRFDYDKPTEKTFLVDGSSLWVIQPKDNQALVDRCFKSDAMTSSLAFLFGQGQLTQQFEIKMEGKAPKGLVRLMLDPKVQQGAYAKLVLDVDPTTARVAASTVVDHQGNLNRFVFSNTKYNQKIEAKKFSYDPPANITVMPIPGSCSKP